MANTQASIFNASCAASYLENYLDCVESLPDDLQRHVSKMRQLDAQYFETMGKVNLLRDEFLEICQSLKIDNPSNQTLIARKSEVLGQIKICLIRGQMLSDDQLKEVDAINALLKDRAEKLDQEYSNLASGFSESFFKPAASSSATSPPSSRSSLLRADSAMCRLGGTGVAIYKPTSNSSSRTDRRPLSAVVRPNNSGGGVVSAESSGPPASSDKTSPTSSAIHKTSYLHKRPRRQKPGNLPETPKKNSRPVSPSGNSQSSAKDFPAIQQQELGETSQKVKNAEKSSNLAEKSKSVEKLSNNAEKPKSAEKSLNNAEKSKIPEKTSHNNEKDSSNVSEPQKSTLSAPCSRDGSSLGSFNAPMGKKRKRGVACDVINKAQEMDKEKDSQPDVQKSTKMKYSLPVDPDEPTYCLCEQVSYGEMIGCDNNDCQIEWYHFNCVGLTSKPKGKWYCPNCRGDKQTVMKD